MNAAQIYGKLQVLERKYLQSYLSVAALASDDLYAADMKKDGIDISRCIHPPDGISLPRGVTYPHR